MEVLEDLEAQRSLSDYLLVRAREASRVFDPNGVGDDEAFGYASAIYDETRQKIAKLEGGGATLS